MTTVVVHNRDGMNDYFQDYAQGRLKKEVVYPGSDAYNKPNPDRLIPDPGIDAGFEKKFKTYLRQYKLAKGLSKSESQEDDRMSVKKDLIDILRQLRAIGDAIEDVRVDERLEEADGMYLEIINLFSHLAISKAENGTNNGMKSNDSNGNFSSSCKLKPFDIPLFDNTIRGYLSFKPKFKALIECRLTPDLALMRLKDECIGKNTIAHYLVRSKNTLLEAWSSLDAEYGKPSVVRDAILKELNEIKPVRDIQNVDAFRMVVTQVNAARDDLKKCNMAHVLGEAAFSVLMNKIPYKVRELIDEEIYDKDLSGEEQVSAFHQNL